MLFSSQFYILHSCMFCQAGGGPQLSINPVTLATGHILHLSFSLCKSVWQPLSMSLMLPCVYVWLKCYRDVQNRREETRRDDKRAAGFKKAQLCCPERMWLEAIAAYSPVSVHSNGNGDTSRHLVFYRTSRQRPLQLFIIWILILHILDKSFQKLRPLAEKKHQTYSLQCKWKRGCKR